MRKSIALIETETFKDGWQEKSFPEMPQRVRRVWSSYWYPWSATSEETQEKQAKEISQWFTQADDFRQSSFLQDVCLLLGPLEHKLRLLVLTFIEYGSVRLGALSLAALWTMKKKCDRREVKEAVDYILRELGGQEGVPIIDMWNDKLISQEIHKHAKFVNRR